MERILTGFPRAGAVAMYGQDATDGIMVVDIAAAHCVVAATYWREIYLVSADASWVLAVNHHHYLIGLGEPAARHVNDLKTERDDRVDRYRRRLDAAPSGADLVEALRAVRQESGDNWLESVGALCAAIGLDRNVVHAYLAAWWNGKSNDLDLAVVLDRFTGECT